VVTTTLTEPAEAERRAPARWVLRGVGVLLVWTVGAVLVGAVMLLTGSGGTAVGPGVAAGAMLLVLVPTWFLVRPAKFRRWLLAGAAAVLVVTGLNLGSLGGPSLAQMTSVGASLPVATGAQLLTTSSVANTLCLQECSQVTHLYAVIDFEIARNQVGAALLADGWDLLGAGGFCRDLFGVRLDDVADPTITEPPAPPPGMELLSVSTSRCERP
jgi:hypothetical protein